ncbi:MAG: hypothetical protein ACE5LA_06355 [Dehalococcoidales bacterium]
MNTKWFSRLIQATVITLALAAVCQELEKPKEERKWCGTIVGFIPYDFRLPTIEKFKDAYWNPYESRIFTPEVFGIGWAINFYALLERLRLIGRAISEEDFLMPGQHMKEVLTHALETD